MKFLLALLAAGALAQDHAAVQALVQNAQVEYRVGRPLQAELLLRQALAAMGPGAPVNGRLVAHQTLGVILANQGKTREAWTELSKAAALNPQGHRLGGLKHSMAMAAWAAGDLDSASRLMAKGIALLDQSGELWAAMVDQAGLEMARGSQSRAAELCRTALPKIEASRAEHASIVMTRIYTCAVIHLETDPASAERQLLTLLNQWAPAGIERAPILAHIARARFRTKGFAGAFAAIDDAIALSRQSDDPQMLAPCLRIRARILRATKRKKEAAECEREAEALSDSARNLVVDVRALRAETGFGAPKQPAREASRQ
ncbi:MAG: hypothetical protein JNL98_21590 [Bryobacterales bacterium]|nr:hypothetical protein [Bryobacterales bacterium]